MKKLPQTPQTLHKTLARARPRQKKTVVVHIPIVEEVPLLEESIQETVERPRSSAPLRQLADGRRGPGVFRFTMSLVGILGIGSLVAVFVIHYQSPQRAPTLSVSIPLPKSDVVALNNASVFHRTLDDMVVASLEEENPSLVAISIDNSEDARPQLGVDRALWVYEFPAESTITRWLGIFAASATADPVPQIGPVRSLRPYMAEIARSLGAVVVHSGGSPDALALEGRFPKDYPSINEFSQTPYFWRDPTRKGPHNLFTAMSRLREHPVLESRTPSLVPLVWKDQAPIVDRGSNKQLVIGYPKPYQARWSYVPSDDLFHRVDEQGNAWKSPSGVELTTSTIVIQFTDIQVLDRVGRRDIRLNGTGEVMVMSHGSVELGQWVRHSANARTTLQTVDGDPLAIKPGRVWWSIVQKGTQVTFE